MKYTKKIPIHLTRMGFRLAIHRDEFSGSDPGLEYDIWKKGVLEVVVQHAPQKFVKVDLVREYKPVANIACFTTDTLKFYDEFFNGNTEI